MTSKQLLSGVTLTLVALSMTVPASDAWALGMTCPVATVQCLEKWGINYQECGELTGTDSRPQEFPTCYDREGDMCAPCWFDGVAATVTACQAAFGDQCRFYGLTNRTWKDGDRILGTIESKAIDPLIGWFRDDIGGN